MRSIQWLAVFLFLSMMNACTVETEPMKFDKSVIELSAKIMNGKFSFEVKDVTSGNRLNGVRLKLIRSPSGKVLYYTSPYDADSDSFNAVSGETYVIECSIRDETFRDSIHYQQIDQSNIEINTDFAEKNGNTIGYYSTKGLDQYPDLITQYSPCLTGHPSISYPLAFSCSDYRVRDHVQNPAFVICGLPFKEESRQLHLFYTDQKSADFIRKREQNASIREYDALFSTNANIYDFSENKQIVGQFYYVNTLTFNVQLEDRSAVRHAIRIIDKRSGLDITEAATELVWSNEMAEDLNISQNEWDALRFERNFSCEKRDRLPFRKEVKFEVSLSYEARSLSGTLTLPLDLKEQEIKVYVE
jgi:hypothetical protein